MKIGDEEVNKQTYLKTINKAGWVKIVLYLNINKQTFINISRKYSTQKALDISNILSSRDHKFKQYKYCIQTTANTAHQSFFFLINEWQFRVFFNTNFH